MNALDIIESLVVFYAELLNEDLYIYIYTSTVLVAYNATNSLV
jgi:hypothetical protein